MSERLVGSFAWEQSEWNSALRAGLICSRRKQESFPTACPNRTMVSMLHTSRIPKVAFCKACCMFLTLRSALHLKLFIWSQISGLTLTLVMSGQFSGLACLASSALSLSLGRVLPHRLDAMLAKRWSILAPTSSSTLKSASRDLRSSTSSLDSVVLAVTSASLGWMPQGIHLCRHPRARYLIHPPRAFVYQTPRGRCLQTRSRRSKDRGGCGAVSFALWVLACHNRL